METCPSPPPLWSVVLLRPEAGELPLVPSARSSVEHWGSLWFRRRRIWQMLVYVATPRRLVAFRFHLFFSSPRLHANASQRPFEPPPTPLPISILDLRCFFFFFLHFFIFFHLLSWSRKCLSLFLSLLLLPLLSAQHSVSVWSHLWPFFSLLLLFLARCHHHLIISGLFDYILCPWLWQGCHRGAFRLILNLQLTHTLHTQI